MCVSALNASPSTLSFFRARSFPSHCVSPSCVPFGLWVKHHTTPQRRARTFLFPSLSRHSLSVYGQGDKRTKSSDTLLTWCSASTTATAFATVIFSHGDSVVSSVGLPIPTLLSLLELVYPPRDQHLVACLHSYNLLRPSITKLKRHRLRLAPPTSEQPEIPNRRRPVLTADMDSMRPTKNIKDEFNIALVIITTIFGCALYIFGGITAYKLHSLDSSLPIYQEARKAAAQNARGRCSVHRSSCTGQLVLVKVLFILFWPFFVAYALGWGAVYLLWRGLRARAEGAGAETEGRVTRKLRERLECERTMPFPRLCRRVMGMERRRGDEECGWPAGGKREEMELGSASVESGKRPVSSVDSNSTLAAGDEVGKEEVKVRCHLEVPTGEQDIADGLHGVPDMNQRGYWQEGKQLPAFQLQQPSPPDRTSSLRGTPALWTIHEAGETDEEDAGADEVDVEIETMATGSAQPAKQDWSPI
ncbi:hypothetical protein B0T14DRAFT_251895 [Immersiella caudata]|uniref:Transmembrane protein n=1 Tax=Immersiella caudata TaxID=314043 RepID=A0AA39WJY3_9PEZI|nr:hypothetical protein B0T14DRAFT_251895 [Immersiella caudata]